MLFAVDFKDFADHMVKKYHGGDFKAYMGLNPSADNLANIEAESPEQAVLEYVQGDTDYYAMDLASKVVYWVTVDRNAQTAKVIRYYP